MSLNVLVIPEDFVKDQYVVKPVVKAMLQALGRPQAKVRVCMDPRLRGVDEAMNADKLKTIVGRYPMVDVFLLLVDRDGREGRRAGLDRREEQVGEVLGEGKVFLGENAWQEVEIWALAGCGDLPSDWAWQDVRAEVNLKETYFDPYVASKGLVNRPGQGRKALGIQAAGNYRRLRSRCPEDIENLEGRLRDALG